MTTLMTGDHAIPISVVARDIFLFFCLASSLCAFKVSHIGVMS
jgi:hypothetical protein